MSDRAVQSSHEGTRVAGKSMHPSQSVWMAHWMQTSFKSHHAHSLSLPNVENYHELKQHTSPSEPEIASDISTSVSRFREASEPRPVKINKGTTSSSNSRNQDLQSFPMFNFFRSAESSLGTKSDLQVLRTQIGQQNESEATGFGPNRSDGPCLLPSGPQGTETLSRGSELQTQEIPWNLEQRSISHCFSKSDHLSTLHSFQDDFMGSAAAVSYGVNNEKSPVQSFMYRRDKLDQSNPFSASKESFKKAIVSHMEHENGNCENHSALIVREKIANCLKYGGPGTSSLGKNDMALLLHDPSTSKHQLLDLLGEKNQNVQNDSAIRLFPSQSFPQGVSESERLYHGCYSLQKVPYSVHDVGTVRICTTVEDFHKGLPMYSQMARHLLITERTEANVSDEGETLRGTMLSTKFKRNAIGEFLSLSPPSEIHGRQRLRLQLLESSTDTEQKEKLEDAKTSEEGLIQESSSKTDTMDMELFQENNHRFDLALSPLNKDIVKGHYTQAAQAKLALANVRAGSRSLNTDLPDINEEPPAIQAATSSTNEAEQSTSRTLSLDVDHLLSHTDYPSSSKSRPCLVGNLVPDPSSRWVKRLKLSSSDSTGHGTKSLRMEEASSHEKMHKFFSKISKGPSTSPDQTLGKSDGRENRELREVGQTEMLVKSGECSSMDSVKECRNITLSHFWIRRWCHSQAASPQKKPEAVALCERQSSKAVFDGFQKKQFPSIAAMALMGKSMYGFPPCEFRKRGPLIVWNTNGL